MKRVCIDTHALIWHLSKPKRLGKSAARLLREADRGRMHVLIPAIVGIELAVLRGAGRKTVGVPQLEALITTQPPSAFCHSISPRRGSSRCWRPLTIRSIE